MTTKRSSIIVINYGRCDLLANFLNSICNSSDLRLVNEVIIVDNGYPQKGDSRDVINSSTFPFKIQFVQNAESSYASGVNRGAALATGEILIISNNDVELLPGCSIQPMLDYLQENPRVGVVGPQLIYPDGSWQRSYGQFPSLREVIISLMMLDSICNGIRKLLFRYNWLGRRPKKVDYYGAFMVVRRSCFEDLGGFNEGYSFYGEDADFCWRAWGKGWKVIFIPGARVMHLRGASSAVEVLEDYTTRLLIAKQHFVKYHFGVRKSNWYLRLMRIVLLERYMLYSLVGKLVRLPTWEQRAFEAHIRYVAARRV